MGNIWYLSPLVLSKWEDLAFSVSRLFEKSVFILQFLNDKMHNYVKQNITKNFNIKKLNNKHIVWCAKNLTQQYSKILLVKSSEIDFIFLSAFYLIICLMKAKKNFEKIAIFKTQELVSFWGVKTHFGKMPLKLSIFRQEKIQILTNILL